MNFKIIASERGMGKSTSLLYTSALTKCPIIVNTVNEIKNLLAQAEKLGLNIIEPITYKEFFYKDLGKHYPIILIDNAESLINLALIHYLHTNVLAITITPDSILKL